jgi:DeoR family glycerol-3-phosphate regulon repressor
VSQTILQQSRKTFLVADASKLKRSAPARIASLSEVDTLFTDAPLPDPLPRKCVEWQTDVVVTPGAGQAAL